VLNEERQRPRQLRCLSSRLGLLDFYDLLSNEELRVTGNCYHRFVWIQTGRVENLFTPR
jgi:hypothetical protein